MEQPNIDYIIKLTNDEEKLKRKFIDIIKLELPLEIEAYYVSLRQNKMQQVSECVHKLKHKIAILGLKDGYLMAEKYENNIREGKKALQQEFENTLNVMRDFVNGL